MTQNTPTATTVPKETKAAGSGAWQSGAEMHHLEE